MAFLVISRSFVTTWVLLNLSLASCPECYWSFSLSLPRALSVLV